MAYISEQYGFAFFAAPATGSSAVIRALQNAGIGEFWPPEPIVEDDRRIAPSKHSTLVQLRAAGIEGKVAGLTKVVGVRNIFSWHVAKYLRNKTSRMRNVRNKKSWIYKLPERERDAYVARLRRHAGMSFAEFLEDRMLENRGDIPTDQQFREGMDIFLHQEILEKDFMGFAKSLDLPSNVELKPYNVTGAMADGETYRDFYTPALIDLIHEKNRSFFVQFPEYSFDGLDRSKITAPAIKSLTRPART